MLKSPLALKLVPVSLALTLVVGATLSGCSTATAPEDDQAPAGQSQTEEEAPDESSDSDAESEIPSWIVDNFPIYPDSEVTTVSETMTGTIIGFEVMTENGDELVAWYNEQYTQNGWTQNLVQDEGARFNAQNAEGYMVVVAVVSLPTYSVATLTATKPMG